jgi:hypothetical protein
LSCGNRSRIHCISPGANENLGIADSLVCSLANGLPAGFEVALSLLRIGDGRGRSEKMIRMSFEQRLTVARVLNRFIENASSNIGDAAVLSALEKWIGQSDKSAIAG